MSARPSQPPKSTTPATPSNLRNPPLPPAAFYGQHNAPRPPLAPAAKGTGGRKPQTLRGAFTKELRALMYAFGDDASPAPDTVNVMEEMVIEYIGQLGTAAVRGQPKPKLTADSLRRVLDRPEDATKLGRLNDLIFHQKNLAEARREF
ncbi:hypothetical protein BS47DRAFT_1335221 [Hydnum rufescens UP504]|uniref:Transcription initiation factor TFIID subunit 13 n=1 Tax=Hydnum rufescens UP504 TaxID=1448309 RepID=A0A9P6BBR9_9AGAM|nr:hypothetical protein BS47DRAFT_1335221 [Hydnum rufescens UP504]